MFHIISSGRVPGWFAEEGRCKDMAEPSLGEEN